MKATSLFYRLRASAANSPITLVHQVPSVSAAAVLAISMAIIFAAASAPSACAQTVTYTGAAVNFGTANVCPSGKTVPAPCSQTLTLTYNVTASGNLGTPKALTTGQPDLDYKLASGSNCAGSVTQGNTCKVNVTFAPIAPGQRNGAVEIVDTSNNVLATTYIYGHAVGPLLGFGSPALSTIATLPGVVAGKALADGSGNLFSIYSTVGSTVLAETVAVNGSVPVNPGIKYFAIPVDPCNAALALDGAGNLFMAACNSSSSEIVEVLAASGYTTSRIISSASSDTVYGIAVDESENLFVLEGASQSYTASTVKELLAESDYATVKTLGGGFAFDDLTDLALDTNGNLFVTDELIQDGPFVGAVEELPVTGGYDTVKIIHVSNAEYYNPFSIAIDAANILFVAMGGGPNGGGGYGEFLAIDGVVPPNPTAVYFSYVNDSVYGYANFSLDGHGNLYSTDYTYEGGFFTSVVQELRFSTPPMLNFSAIAVGHTSPDSPQSVQVVNKGSAALDLSALSISPSWELVPGSGTPPACTAGTSLLPAAQCNLNISFKPLEAGALTGAVTIVDNSLNTTQSIPLTGTGISGPQIVSLNWTYGAPYSVVILNGFNFGDTQGSSTVTFNGIPTPHYYWADTKIYTTVPPNATTGNIVATVNGVASNPVPFTVVPMPVVTGISPTSGINKTLVTISGKNLLDHGNHGTVTFNGESLPLLSQSSTALQVEIPDGAVTGKFHVLVNDTGINTSTFIVPTDPLTFSGSQTDFGSANVCPSGKTIPAPCSKTLTLTYTVNAGAALGTPLALTTGQPNLDYTLAGGSTCVGRVTAGSTCMVNVKFAPIAPGARNGSVEIVDASGNVLATTLISGSGMGALAAFGPPATTTVASKDLVFPSALVADASGNIFVFDNNEIKELLAVNGSVPANPVVRVLSDSRGYQPFGFSIDGAGNIFFGDSYAGITQLVAAGGYTEARMIYNSPPDFFVSDPAVDGSGNLFFISYSDNGESAALQELLAADNYSSLRTLANGDFLNLGIVALDDSRNLFIPDFTGLVEITAASGYTTVRTITVPSFYSNTILGGGVVVDPAGNIFLTLSQSTTGQPIVEELLAVNGVVPSNPQTLFFHDSVLQSSGGLALDGRGNLFVTGTPDLATNGSILRELQFSALPPLNFATAPIGYASGDSPQAIQIQNRGTADLDLNSFSISPNWDIVPGSGTTEDCAPGLSLVPSALCELNISFKPTEAGALTGQLTATDNSLNAPGSTQSGALTGTGVTSGPPPPHITSLSPTSGLIDSAVTLTGTNFGAIQGSSTVTFSGIVAPVSSWSNTSVVIAVPVVNTFGSYNVIVTVAGEASNPIAFTVN